MRPIEVTLLFITQFINLINSQYQIVSENQLTVDGEMIWLHSQQCWLDGAVDPYTNKWLC